MESPDELYAMLVTEFRSRPHVIHSDAKGFGRSSLMFDGRIFAMLVHGSLVVKLPKLRVDELIVRGFGPRFDANRGVPLKEWLIVRPEHGADWLKLAKEAMLFVSRT